LPRLVWPIGVDSVAVPIAQAGDGVAEHRQHRIERQRQYRGQEAERGKPKTEPAHRQRGKRQQQWIEQRE